MIMYLKRYAYDMMRLYSVGSVCVKEREQKDTRALAQCRESKRTQVHARAHEGAAASDNAAERCCG